MCALFAFLAMAHLYPLQLQSLALQIAKRKRRSPRMESSSNNSRQNQHTSYLRPPMNISMRTSSISISISRCDAIRAELSKHPVKTRVSLTGTIVVARDIAHAKD
jgi:hypothetical protein